MTTQRFDVRVDVTGAGGLGEHLEIAATVYAPATVPASTDVIFAFPGGGYNRHYYDLQLPGYRNYSQAEHHTAQGFVVVSVDHIGTGDSDIPRTTLDYSAIAALDASAVDLITKLIGGGGIDGLAPIEVATRIGIGQSYGALLLTFLEGERPTFDGVAFLGWSGIQSMPRTDIGMPAMAALQLAPTSGLAHPLRPSMHYDDEPEEIVEQDMRGWPHRDGVPVPPWAAVYMPGGPNEHSDLSPVDAGVVAAPAARIACPVLTASGERDVCADPRTEPQAYPSSPDITVFVLPHSAHMHNFAATRRRLWERIDAWAGGVVAVSHR
jgi:alpha-beta hydrolase superfamily lysophospholipase